MNEGSRVGGIKLVAFPEALDVEEYSIDLFLLFCLHGLVIPDSLEFWLCFLF